MAGGQTALPDGGQSFSASYWLEHCPPHTPKMVVFPLAGQTSGTCHTITKPAAAALAGVAPDAGATVAEFVPGPPHKNFCLGAPGLGVAIAPVEANPPAPTSGWIRPAVAIACM